MHKVFLDANVLFSAAYTPNSRLLALWKLDDAEMVTSEFALLEARRNLLVHSPEAVPVLDELAEKTTIAAASSTPDLPRDLHLAEKDVPILAAAVEAGCSHLLTGDKRHFDQLYGKRVRGVLVRTPAQYLADR